MTDEAVIREQCARGEFERAATTAVRTYGPQLLGYLHAVARAPAEAEDAFSEYCERLWRGLPTFRWDSSLRTWSYRVARNLLIDRRRVEGRRPKVDAVGSAGFSQIADRVRTETAEHLRTAAKDRLHEIRESLDPDDQTLLILSVDRGLTWREIAEVMGEGGDLDRVAARLRKRFERLKQRLRAQMAQ